MSDQILVNKICPCCGYTKPLSDYVELSKDFGSIEICGICCSMLTAEIEANRQRKDTIYKEKRAKREQKLFKKFMNRGGRRANPTNPQAIGCLIFLICFVLVFIWFINQN